MACSPRPEFKNIDITGSTTFTNLESTVTTVQNLANTTATTTATTPPPETPQKKHSSIFALPSRTCVTLGLTLSFVVIVFEYQRHALWYSLLLRLNNQPQHPTTTTNSELAHGAECRQATNVLQTVL